ncbi:hypothetical protein ETAA8_43980 [Anatilimnocola aggregata]|uniref:HPF/RaiA family ribosome-associated protein n=1 Tax=Anatilimnocola aggregata TaxID=2528021 RepID=A0A517YGD7_9BACT|nr:hypothetical protein [Anatilimnocola aggregata]QDU29290.1 hypothetical protein ETAA8_43980 [Anatilimnocola aggregata]
MKVFVYSNGLELSENYRLTLHSRLESVLSHFGRSINRVNVYLQDANGQKGGVDKVCRLVVHLRRQPSVVIEDRDAELAPLIGRVLERASQVTQRKFTRRRSRSGAGSMSGG